MAVRIRTGDCVKIPDGRIARVRERVKAGYRVRVRRKSSKTHQIVVFPVHQLQLVNCPKGWMSRDGYNRYLKITLAKMTERVRNKKRVRRV